jgi:hypothetical protein
LNQSSINRDIANIIKPSNEKEIVFGIHLGILAFTENYTILLCQERKDINSLDSNITWQ